MKPKKTKASASSPVITEKLAQAAWHEALVRITSGLVHDANNSLAGVVSLSEHVLEVAEKQPSFKEELTLINQAGHKAGEILRKFVQVNPMKLEEPTYYDLNAVTTESVDLLQRALKRKLQLEVQLAAGPLPVFLDGLELKKAIICLGFNLADSITERGKMFMRTSLPTDPVPARVYQGTWPKGPTVCLSISTAAQESGALNWEELFEPELKGDETTDLFRMRFCLVKRVLEGAKGATSLQSSEASGLSFSLFLPKANLD